jgi:hypothetical protein
VFLIGLLGQTFSKSLIVLNFRMNQKSIAATKCVNRFKPKSCCHGTCYLNKQLSKDEKSQDTPLNSGANFKFEVLLYSEKKAETRFIAISNNTVHQSRYIDPVSQQAIASVDHPPQVLNVS